MNQTIHILKHVGAFLPDDHFVGTSGKHFDTYINKDALFPHTKETSEIGKFFAEAHSDLDIDVVAAPAMGGIILSQWTAHHLSLMKDKEILSIYAEKKDGKLKLTRGYDEIAKRKNILVIEDLTSTGGSLKEAIDVIREAEGNIIAAAVMVNKNPSVVTSELFECPFTALADHEVTLYNEEECMLCQKEVPINTSIGHGQAFVNKNL